jgi:hypothetical protein
MVIAMGGESRATTIGPADFGPNAVVEIFDFGTPEQLD